MLNVIGLGGRAFRLWISAFFLFSWPASAAGAPAGQGLSFRLGQVLSSAPYPMTRVLADVDGDGDLDLFLGTFDPKPDVLFLNDGKGHFRMTGPWRFHGLGEETSQAEFLDLDGDGDLDLFLGTNRAVRLLFNDGRGFFRERRKVFPPLLGKGPYFGLGDLDGDGDKDLLVRAWRKRVKGSIRAEIQYYLNQGKGRFSGPVTLNVTVGFAERPFSFDINNDGLSDVLETPRNADDRPGWKPPIMFFRNLGGLKFREDSSLNLPEFFGYSLYKDNMFGFGRLLAGDIDGDGLCDLAVPRWGTHLKEELAILLNQKGRGFKEDEGFRELQRKWITERGCERWSIPYPFLYDMDGDGRLDLVAAVFWGKRGKRHREILFFMNRGKLGFQIFSMSPDLLRGRKSPRPVLGGDLNGDGLPDLIVECGGMDKGKRIPLFILVLFQEGKKGSASGRGPATPGAKSSRKKMP